MPAIIEAGLCRPGGQEKPTGYCRSSIMFTSKDGVTLSAAGLIGLAAAGLGSLSMVGISSGSVIETNSSSTASSFTVVTSGDLLLNNTSATQSGGGYLGASSVTPLFDGLAPISSVGATNTGNFYGAQDGATVTVPIASATIGSIITYTAWQNQGREHQNYTLSYSTDGGTSYTALTTVAYDGPSPGTTMGLEVQLALSTPITGVTDLQWTFNPNNITNGVAYTELAAYAPAGAPEPATLGLLAIGGLTLLARRRTSA